MFSFSSNQFTQNLRLLEAFNNFKWYLLPIDDQKCVMLEIFRLQNGVDLHIGPFQQLNFETLKIVSKPFLKLLKYNMIQLTLSLSSQSYILAKPKSVFDFNVYQRNGIINCIEKKGLQHFLRFSEQNLHILPSDFTPSLNSFYLHIIKLK